MSEITDRLKAIATKIAETKVAETAAKEAIIKEYADKEKNKALTTAERLDRLEKLAGIQ